MVVCNFEDSSSTNVAYEVLEEGSDHYVDDLSKNQIYAPDELTDSFNGVALSLIRLVGLGSGESQYVPMR